MLEFALLHQTQHAPFLPFSATVYYILHKWRRQERNKIHRDPESKVSDPKRWHPGFTDCKKQVKMSLERQVPELPTLTHRLSWDQSTRFYKHSFGAFNKDHKDADPEEKYPYFVLHWHLPVFCQSFEDVIQRDSLGFFPVISNFENTLLASHQAACLSPSSPLTPGCALLSHLLLQTPKSSLNNFLFLILSTSKFHTLFCPPFCLPDT